MTSPLRPRSTVVPLLETGQLRVTRHDFAPGAETGWHGAAADYLIVTLTDCSLRLELPGVEASDRVMDAGTAHAFNAGDAHNIINSGTTTMAFIEVEVKPPA